MKNPVMVRRTLALLLGSGLIVSAGASFAMDFGNMMNPSKWMGGGRDRDRDYLDGPGYGYGGPGYGPGYGWGGPGYGYGGPGYGYGGPGYGYGAPGYGYGGPAPGVPGYGAPQGPVGASAGPGAPQAGNAGNQAEIDSLRRRLNELEQGQAQVR
jgi:hypothetical protein